MGNDRRARGIGAAVGGMVAPSLAGIAAGMALPPAGWPWLLWPALAVLWGRAGAAPPWRAGLPWGLGAVLVSHRWLLWLHPLDWIGVPAPLSLPLCLLLWVLCGVAGGGLVALWQGVVRALGTARPATAVIGACLWGLAEVALSRSPLFWLGIGAAALPGDPPLAGLAALGGAGALAALQVVVGWCLWRALTAGPGRRLAALAGAVLVVGGHVGGAAALAATPPDGPFRERLLVLQPAIPTREKFTPARQRDLLEQLEGALHRAGEGNGGAPPPTLLLPEGSLVQGQSLPLPASGEVLSGGFRRQGEELRSSVLRFAPGERRPGGWIDKTRVVPLGEWVPLAGLWRWSGLSAVGGIEPGPPGRLLERPGGAIGVAICYELSDGAALAAASRGGARWLLATANLDPYPLLLQEQFTALARLRAIEGGRWLVSAANTGPSLTVNARGDLVGRLPAGVRATEPLAVVPRSALTGYARWGEAPLLVLLALAALLRLRSVRELARRRCPP